MFIKEFDRQSVYCDNRQNWENNKYNPMYDQRSHNVEFETLSSNSAKMLGKRSYNQYNRPGAPSYPGSSPGKREEPKDN